MKITIISLLIVAVIIGAGFLLFKYGNPSKKDLPQIGEAFPIVSRTHIEIGAAHEPYNSNPPTSGPHYAQEAAWGVYQQILPDEQLVHNLEHGGIWISYKDVDAQTKANLEEIGEEYPNAVIVTPRPKDDTKISLASWGRLEKLDSFDRNKIIMFIKANMNKSPEPLAQ